MPAEETAKEAPPQAPRLRNTGLHGAFWTQMLLKVLRFMPVWLCLPLNALVVAFIYLMAGPQRQAVLANLQGLRPDFGLLRRWWAGYQVFLQFALTYLDRLWHMHFKREVTWDIPNLSHFEEMRAHPGGVLVFTIHSGNYDIGATLFAQKFGRTLHMVRVPEQTAELQELRAAELQSVERENPHLRVHYNEVDSHLGLELCRILMAGEAVAVQGDRVVTGVSPIEMDHEGVTFKIPRGPLVLAEISRVPCYPIFLQRLGILKYRIVCGPCFYDGKTKIRADDLGKVWLPIMHRFVHEHWDQWFVFEALVKEAKSAPPDEPAER
ncbi:lauroyl/myristoyl acyltransferase [Prosthecobacter fusiformis]|uniref:Lauroyl/myristoyl acyltransferase n=1 Tax=Prosthecobacter fusiformis TaxID=48464 RepID=A0A4R7SU03_9BACT|nr:hypothetical protein [Prosthecobacter fusiformis]TDU81758.1 lauroyl/myristoyl acyltransferase [Prosthecobacter fusiformis]